MLPSEEVPQPQKHANEGRDYSVYTRLMDAALEAKARSMISRFGEIAEGAVIVDVGSGTGKVAEYIAREFHNMNVHVYAVDVSHELLDVANENRTFIKLLYDNATTLDTIPDNSVDIFMHGTVGHEIYSFLGEEGLRQSLKAAHRGLKPGKLEEWRDFAKPDFEGPVLLQILTQDDGCNSQEEALVDGFLDYSRLSTRALFNCFHQEFMGGNAFDYREREIDGRAYIELPARFAHEFCLRKDYVANWRQEIKEQYLYWTRDEAKRAFVDAGFKDVRVEDDDNDYIRTTRLRGKVALFIENEAHLTEIEPITHMVITGRKPEGGAIGVGVIEAVDYNKLLSTILIDERNNIIRISGEAFAIDRFIDQGAHKRVYALKDGKHVIKIVRDDRTNTHNVFKSMQQMIDRQHVLDEYGVEYLHLTGKDPNGPPYRYVIQEIAPAQAESAAQRIISGLLSETEIAQLAHIVSSFELQRKWQIDTNPHNWYSVTGDDMSRKLIYVGGTVYSFDELWAFSRIGLLQWMDQTYILQGEYASSVIPTAMQADAFALSWEYAQDPQALLWKKYLAKAVQPSSVT